MYLCFLIRKNFLGFYAKKVTGTVTLPRAASCSAIIFVGVKQKGCLLFRVPELNGADPAVLHQILDNVAYIMPGL
jgi:hypothetical protein